MGKERFLDSFPYPLLQEAFQGPSERWNTSSDPFSWGCNLSGLGPCILAAHHPRSFPVSTSDLEYPVFTVLDSARVGLCCPYKHTSRNILQTLKGCAPIMSLRGRRGRRTEGCLTRFPSTGLGFTARSTCRVCLHPTRWLVHTCSWKVVIFLHESWVESHPSYRHSAP